MSLFAEKNNTAPVDVFLLLSHNYPELINGLHGLSLKNGFFSYR
jgi:hypothetical protein